jgi:hypothetical protein
MVWSAAHVQLCPKQSWTPAMRAAMNKIDADGKRFEASGER